MGKSTALPNHGSAAPYGPIRSNCGRGLWCHGWFACLWVPNNTRLKLRDGRSLALSGQNLMITHNNHPEIDDRFSVMEVEEVARGGWRSAWGEVVPSFRVVIL